MLFGFLAILFFVATGLLILWSVFTIMESETVSGLIIIFGAVLSLLVGIYFQTHRIVPTQNMGITKHAFTQELSGPYKSGVISKPFFSSVYNFPSSSSYERCEQYTPAIKGSYGITLDICFYYDTGNVDWLAEINKTGFLEYDGIMSVWRNSVVGDVAKSVKDYTPEELSDSRSEVEESIFKNVLPWFNERGIGLVSISFKNWDFTSEDVAKSFDESIVSQRKITEQTALFEASKIARERQVYEAETAKIVAEKQKESLELLGLKGEAAVQYLWIKLMEESNKIPDVIILGNANVPVSIPLEQKEADFVLPTPTPVP